MKVLLRIKLMPVRFSRCLPQVTKTKYNITYLQKMNAQTSGNFFLYPSISNFENELKIAKVVA